MRYRTTAVAMAIAALGPALAHAQTPATSTAASTQAPPSASPSWEFSGGATYLRGKYGQPASTGILYAPFTATLRSPRWKLDVTVPYLSVRGPGGVVGAGATPVVVGPSSLKTTTRSGLGDVTVGGSVMLPYVKSLPFFELAARVKAPTAASNLGTGRADLTTQVNAYQTLSPKVTALASLGYQWLGSSPTFHLKNGVIAQAGLVYKAADAVDLGLTGNYTASVAKGLDDQVTVTPFVSWRVARQWGLTAYALGGATRSSPNWGAGFQLTLYP